MDNSEDGLFVICQLRTMLVILCYNTEWNYTLCPMPYPTNLLFSS